MRFGISCFVSSFAHFTILWKNVGGILILIIVLYLFRLGHDVDTMFLLNEDVVLSCVRNRMEISPHVKCFWREPMIQIVKRALGQLTCSVTILPTGVGSIIL